MNLKQTVVNILLTHLQHKKALGVPDTLGACQVSWKYILGLGHYCSTDEWGEFMLLHGNSQTLNLQTLEPPILQA